MKNFITAVSFVLSSLAASAQHYAPQDEHSKVAFTVVNHFIITTTVNGTLQGLKGNIMFDPANLQAASFDVSVNAATVKTGIGKRDEHLHKEEFFNVQQFPEIRIVSTKIEKGKADNTYVLYGTLTMKGISKPVTIPFNAIPAANGMTFKGTFTLNRLDYTIGDRGKIENEVIVHLDVFARKM